jgi:hypothetical protein
VNAITTAALSSPKAVRVPTRLMQSPHRMFALGVFTNAAPRVRVRGSIQSTAADEYRDLGDAFAEFADESLEWANGTFEAVVETWPSE